MEAVFRGSPLAISYSMWPNMKTSSSEVVWEPEKRRWGMIMVGSRHCSHAHKIMLTPTISLHLLFWDNAIKYTLYNISIQQSPQMIVSQLMHTPALLITPNNHTWIFLTSNRKCLFRGTNPRRLFSMSTSLRENTCKDDIIQVAMETG